MPNTVHNAFDVLHLDDKNLTRRPYVERRATLTDLASGRSGRTVEFPCNWTDVDLSVVLAASAEVGLEWILCKHLDSPYLPGKRSRDWIKTPHRLRSEFVIGGWLPGMGVNRHTVGAVLVGAHTADGRLLFCGVVGVGLSAAERRRLTKALQPLQRSKSPLAGVPPDIARYGRWVHANLVGDVEYRECRGTLRHPLLEGPSTGRVRHRHYLHARVAAWRRPGAS
jgi:bifunctional non-homologous end joining protein LigD